jgi:hypothetical protein
VFDISPVGVSPYPQVYARRRGCQEGHLLPHIHQCFAHLLLARSYLIHKNLPIDEGFRVPLLTLVNIESIKDKVGTVSVIILTNLPSLCVPLTPADGSILVCPWLPQLSPPLALDLPVPFVGWTGASPLTLSRKCAPPIDTSDAHPFGAGGHPLMFLRSPEALAPYPCLFLRFIRLSQQLLHSCGHDFLSSD